MIFNIKKLNCILNNLLRNNAEARHFFVDFIRDLPEEILDIVRDCECIEHVGDNYELNCFFDYSKIQVEIFYNNKLLFLEMNPITRSQIKDIPFDQEHDIFLDMGYTNLNSPAFFNIIYNPDCDIYETSVETPDIAYYIVEQKDGYHLISQSMEDAGIHNTKIDIEDFIFELANENATNLESPIKATVNDIEKTTNSNKKGKQKKKKSKYFSKHNTDDHNPDAD